MPSKEAFEAELDGYKRYGKKDRAKDVEEQMIAHGFKKKPAAKKK